MVIWYNVWTFGVVCGPLVYFSRFVIFWTKKNLAALPTTNLRVQIDGGRFCLFFFNREKTKTKPVRPGTDVSIF
jgi:hypothetical protein